MKNNLVEKYDRAMLRGMSWIMVAIIVNIVVITAYNIVIRDGLGHVMKSNPALFWSATGLVILGLVMVFAVAGYLLVISKKIKKDKNVNTALSNEMYVLNSYKSYSVAAKIMFLTGILFSILYPVIPIQTGPLLWLTSMGGALAFCISWLYFNR